MPIIDVELVLAPGETPVSDLARQLADAAAAVFGSEPRRTWVKLRFIQPDLYAENGGAEEGTYPVFVIALKSTIPRGKELEEEVLTLTRSIARVCDRPEGHVHILYQPDAAGRTAFGGKVVG